MSAKSDALHFVPATLEQAKAKISELNFSLLKQKLVAEGADPQAVEIMEAQYKAFLFLKFKYPNEEIVPTKFIDSMWHAHILDTTRYANDCISIFGTFIHHYPYYGMRGEADFNNWRASFSKTCERFLEIGVDIGVKAAMCGGDVKAAMCGGDVKAAMI